MMKFANVLLHRIGLELVKTKHLHRTDDMEPSFLEYYRHCQPFTMTSVERMYALFKSVEYIIQNRIEGDYVECGVWKGGSSMLAAHALIYFQELEKRIYLYDTFEGMSAPVVHDLNLNGEPAETTYRTTLKSDGTSGWCYSSLDEVRENMGQTGYPEEHLFYIKGKVEDTIPGEIPQEISLLRLDTDWYESTLHELKHLFPRLKKGGVLILDDYGHWKGARKAADEFFNSQGIRPYLSRIDYTGRMYIKDF